ncbi:hypothetical protein DXV75_01300 [Alteromonas aestuariivivens]|uniref:CopL family metal-binding regulatory protein n=1 Tax=Alteromonas aestuariivivens TaxID=1938339 RepID=A0A3D8ME66_9ALTE|nr:hypothetical protein [Alteromonas aestuariivivens]RDV29127.1 hypothetical protein DXV75_01300 [Alteromonas aestuariivivens]
MNSIARLFTVFAVMVALCGQAFSYAEMHCEMAMQATGTPASKPAQNSHAAMGHAMMQHGDMNHDMAPVAEAQAAQDCCASDCQCPMNACTSYTCVSFQLQIAEAGVQSEVYAAAQSATPKSSITSLYRPPIIT